MPKDFWDLQKNPLVYSLTCESTGYRHQGLNPKTLQLCKVFIVVNSIT